jgi:hypothetical protein
LLVARSAFTLVSSAPALPCPIPASIFRDLAEASIVERDVGALGEGALTSPRPWTGGFSASGDLSFRPCVVSSDPCTATALLESNHGDLVGKRRLAYVWKPVSEGTCWKEPLADASGHRIALFQLNLTLSNQSLLSRLCDKSHS